MQPHHLVQRPETIYSQPCLNKIPKLQNNQELYLYNCQNHQAFIKVGYYVPTVQTVGIIRGPPLPTLTPEHTDNFVKRCGTSFNEYEDRGVPLQFLPSPVETYYQEEMFYYNMKQPTNTGPTYQVFYSFLIAINHN